MEGNEGKPNGNPGGNEGKSNGSHGNLGADLAQLTVSAL
jgi:hypothetical protein